MTQRDNDGMLDPRRTTAPPPAAAYERKTSDEIRVAVTKMVRAAYEAFDALDDQRRADRLNAELSCLLDLEAAELALADAHRSHHAAIMAAIAERAELRSRLARALEVADDALQTIESGRLASIGSIHNTYEPQVGVDHVKQMRATLRELRGEQAKEQGPALQVEAYADRRCVDPLPVRKAGAIILHANAANIASEAIYSEQMKALVLGGATIEKAARVTDRQTVGASQTAGCLSHSEPETTTPKPAPPLSPAVADAVPHGYTSWLDYVLTESDRPRSVWNDSLRHAKAELATLRAALEQRGTGAEEKT